MSTPVSAYLHGIFPRSDALIAATRDLERGRTDRATVEARRAEDTEALVALQRDAGMDLYSDGMPLWQDIFRVVVEASDGLEPDGLVRWFDTNSFYRVPTLTGGPVLRRPELLGVGSSASTAPSVPTPRVATLPSPLLFSRVVHLAPGGSEGARSEDAGSADTDRDALLLRLTVEVLRPAADVLVAAGCTVIHLEEPWVVTHDVGQASWETLGEALEVFGAGLGAAVVLHTSFGDAGPVMDRMRELPVDAVGVDMVETDVESLGADWTCGLVVGCLNGRSSLVESVDVTVKVAKAAVDRARPSALYLSSGTSFDLLPRAVAADKVRVVGEATRRLREELG